LLEQEAELVDAVHEAVAREAVDREGHALAVRFERRRLEIDAHLGAGIVEQPAMSLQVDDDGQQAVLQRVAAKDVGDRSAHDGANPEVEQRPRRVLARRAAAEVVAADEHARAAILGLVQNEVRKLAAVLSVAPVVEQILAETLFRRGREKARRNDLVGVDVVVRQHDSSRANVFDRFHRQPTRSRGSVIAPLTAAAAAVSGLASTVRAPVPWRPSKLGLLVLTDSLPLGTVSPFIPMHMEQPGSRHSPPAALTTSSRPSASAWRLTSAEPGTTSKRTRLSTWRPRRIRAASRMSLRRPFVHEPMNTT